MNDPTRRGIPNLTRYNKPLSHYVRLYDEYLTSLKQKGESVWTYRKRVDAIWGLIAKGAEALPYALQMLINDTPEAREDAGGILAELGKVEGVLEAILERIEQEHDQQALASLVLTVGAFRDSRAIPKLAALIRSPDTNGDTQWTAIESLGKIVKKRFLQQADPFALAKKWLLVHGY